MTNMSKNKSLTFLYKFQNIILIILKHNKRGLIYLFCSENFIKYYM